MGVWLQTGVSQDTVNLYSVMNGKTVCYL